MVSKPAHKTRVPLSIWNVEAYLQACSVRHNHHTLGMVNSISRQKYQ